MIKKFEEWKMNEEVHFDFNKHFPGFAESAKDFETFSVLDYIRDPGYGYDHVYMFLIKFDKYEKGAYGLCIWDTRKKEFIEEPSDLEDYNTTLEKIKEKYGLDPNKRKDILFSMKALDESESSKKLSLSFRFDEHGNVDIMGKKYSMKELFRDYDHLIDYAFATYFGKKLVYRPEYKRFYIARDPEEKGQAFDANFDKAVFRSVKVKPGFITGMQLDSIMRNTKGAADYRDKKYYIQILDADENVIRTYSVNKTTGELS